MPQQQYLDSPPAQNEDHPMSRLLRLRRSSRIRKGPLLFALATSLVLAVAVPMSATVGALEPPQGVEALPTSPADCGYSPNVAAVDVTPGSVDAAGPLQEAAVSERLLEQSETFASGPAALQVTPRPTPGTSYTATSSSEGLQIIGRSDYIGFLSFEFAHRSGCAPEDQEIKLDSSEGYVEVATASGPPLRYGLAEPWAVDAAGRDLPTWFEADGTVLRQMVDATAAEAPIVFDPTYSNVACLGHWSSGNAAFYMNTYPDDPAYCTVYGMLSAQGGYTPVWGFEANLANDYGKLMIRQTGECSYLSDTGPNYDFQVPCKAHDFCYDLRRASFSGTVSDSDCDGWLYYFAEANCNDRSGFAADDCRFYRDSVYSAVTRSFVVADPSPGEVEFYNRGALNCADVEGPSFADGAPLQSWDCVGVANQRFRVWPAPGAPGFFHIKSVYSGKCVRALTSTSSVTQQTCNDSFASMRMLIQGALNDNQYSLREQNPGAHCWHVPGNSFSNGTNLDHPPCDDYDRWYLWRIFDA